MQPILLGQDANRDLSAVHLSDYARSLGTYVIGTTGTGKSTFLRSLILQDVFAGKGVCVLDPHGDLVDEVLPFIPSNRVNDVILFDPADIAYPLGLNLFACDRSDPRQRDLVTSSLIDTFYKLFYTSWGPRMEDLLRHSIQTLLYVPDSTFLELLLLLTNHEQRKRLSQPGSEVDPILKHYWQQQFPESYEDPKQPGKWRIPDEQLELVSSSLNKIGRFLVNPVIRNIIAQAESALNFRAIMDEGKVLLINLSKGDIGADNSSFLGSVIVNQLLLAALTRRELPPNQRRPFYLYVDEYQNFATESFPQLQSEARKFKITTTVAHQYRDQLDDSNRGSTLNVANLIVFRVSGKDALELAGQFDNTPQELPPHYQPIYADIGQGVSVPIQTSGSQTGLFREIPGLHEPYSDAHLETANLLTMLPQHQAIIRILNERSKELAQYRVNTQPFDCPLTNHTEHIRRASRQLGRSVEEVEKSIKARLTSSVEYLPRQFEIPSALQFEE